MPNFFPCLQQFPNNALICLDFIFHLIVPRIVLNFAWLWLDSIFRWNCSNHFPPIFITFFIFLQQFLNFALLWLESIFRCIVSHQSSRSTCWNHFYPIFFTFLIFLQQFLNVALICLDSIFHLIVPLPHWLRWTETFFNGFLPEIWESPEACLVKYKIVYDGARCGR